MRSERFCIQRRVALAVMILAVLAVHVWAGTGTERVLHNFNPHQGSHPSGIIFGTDGNIYGITILGGAYGAGTIYELTPAAGGRWLETRVLSFGLKGSYPNLVSFDSAGNLFGTAEHSLGGCGEVFELSLNAAGHWQETILYSLSCAEGLYPESPLVRDASGNLYGTVWGGGTEGKGTVFELSPTSGGSWTFKVLHSFTGADGSHLQSAVAIDASGNLYGTALCGGAAAAVQVFSFPPDCGGDPGIGTVWELSPQSDGSWTETTLYSSPAAMTVPIRRRRGNSSSIR